MPVASATGILGESIQARRAAHERAEIVSPAGLEVAAHMVRRLTPVDTSGKDLPPSGLYRVVRDKLDNAWELERVLFKERSDEEAARRNLSIVVRLRSQGSDRSGLSVVR